MNEPGFVYALINPSMPGLVKIGRTNRDPVGRVEELSAATGVPTPFLLLFHSYFEDASAAEKYVHTLLEIKGKRVANNREFFQIEPSEAIHVMIAAPGRVLIVAETTPPRSQPEDDSELLDSHAVAGNDSGSSALATDLLDQGMDHYLGLFDELQDHKEAMNCFKRAARLGSTEALLLLGDMYAAGEGVREDSDEALEYYRNAARLGNFYAYLEMWKVFIPRAEVENAAKCLNRFFAALGSEPMSLQYRDPAQSLYMYLQYCVIWGITPATDQAMSHYRDEIAKNIFAYMPVDGVNTIAMLRWVRNNLFNDPTDREEFDTIVRKSGITVASLTAGTKSVDIRSGSNRIITGT